MPAKTHTKKQEPLINTVARKLGHAAGKLTRATQELTENLSAFPETVTTKLREAATVLPAGGPHSRARRTNDKNKKKIRNAGRVPRAKTAAAPKKHGAPKDKSPRSSSKPSSTRPSNTKK